MTTPADGKPVVRSPQWRPGLASLDYNRSPPSFAYKSREVLRHRQLSRDHPRWRLIEKLGAYAMLDRLGVPHAEVYEVVRGYSKLAPAHLSRPVVVKPVIGKSARGVLYLRPDGGDAWFNHLDGQRSTLDEIQNQLREVVEQYKFRDAWILEEPMTPVAGAAATGPVADDYKVYAFQGEVGVVLQRRARGDVGRRYRWYDAGWQPVTTGKYTNITDNTLEPPPDPEADAVLEVARRVSTAVPLAFCRVDTYVTEHGVRVGEVNSWTGHYDQFNEDWDQHLGAMWEAAEVRVPTEWPQVPASTVAGGYPAPWLSRWSGGGS